MVKLSKPSIQRFKEQTKFQIMPFATLYEQFKTAAASTEQGELDKPTFLSVARSIFATDQAELLTAIFEYLDLDDNGTIDAGELLCALNIFCSGTSAEKAEVCFAAFDLDNNGWLSKEEFLNMLNTTLVTSRDLLIDLLGHFAEDDDPLTVETVVLRTLKADAVRVIADAAWDSADEDGDGRVVKAEFESWALRQDFMIDFFSTFDKLFAHDEPQDVQATGKAVGAPSDVAAPSDEHVALAASVRDQIVAKMRDDGEETEFQQYELVGVRTQVVAGTMFFLKIKVGESAFVHAKVFRDLPHNASALSCVGVQSGLTSDDSLEFF